MTLADQVRAVLRERAATDPAAAQAEFREPVEQHGAAAVATAVVVER
ncbi:hypothetical protein [Saccharopolyspora cebuensis]